MGFSKARFVNVKQGLVSHDPLPSLCLTSQASTEVLQFKASSWHTHIHSFSIAPIFFTTSTLCRRPWSPTCCKKMHLLGSCGRRCCARLCYLVLYMCHMCDLYWQPCTMFIKSITLTGLWLQTFGLMDVMCGIHTILLFNLFIILFDFSVSSQYLIVWCDLLTRWPWHISTGLLCYCWELKQGRVSLGVSASPLSASISVSVITDRQCWFLTVWSLSCQWSTVPPVRPWACCQSQHPPKPGSGTRGTCSFPPAAGVWFCRASSVLQWQSETPLDPSSSCHRSQASWTWRCWICQAYIISQRWTL